MQFCAQSSKRDASPPSSSFQKIDNKLLCQCLGTTLLPKLLTLHICFVHSPPLFLALSDSALPTRKRLRLQTPARWLRDQPPLLSALQYKSRIAMRTWRRPLLKRMTILHALLRRGCSWKPYCLNKFETAWSCLLFCFFSLLCCHHLHT